MLSNELIKWIFPNLQDEKTFLCYQKFQPYTKVKIELWTSITHHWRRQWQPTPVFLPGESQGRRSLMGCCLWVAQSWTRLKRLSSSSSSNPSLDSMFIKIFDSFASFAFFLFCQSVLKQIPNIFDHPPSTLQYSSFKKCIFFLKKFF